MTALIKLTSKGKPCIVNAAACLDTMGQYYFPGKFHPGLQIKVGARARFSTNTVRSTIGTVLDVNSTAEYPLKIEYDVAGVGKRIEVFSTADLIEWLPLN